MRPESTWNQIFGVIFVTNKGWNLPHLLTLIKVYTAFKLLGGVVNVVLENELAGHRPSSQLEPSPTPFLEKIIFDLIIHWLFVTDAEREQEEKLEDITTLSTHSLLILNKICSTILIQK